MSQIMHSSSYRIKRKSQFLYSLASTLLLSTIIGVAGVESKSKISKNILSTTAHTIAKSSCSSTFYPELCYSSVADSLTSNNREVNSIKDVIFLSLNVAIKSARRNYVVIENLIATGNRNLTHRENLALHDCLVTIDETLDELHAAKNDLENYPTKKSIQQHAEDLKTLVSSAITNQETCLDGFSHGKTDKHVREVLVGGQVLGVEKLCSNSLAMICNMTNTDMENERKLNGGRNLEEEEEKDWPKWVSAGDRRLLQSSTVRPDVVVAADGSGNFRTVSAAVAAAPERSSRRYVIRIKAGVYRENVEVGKKKTNIMFMGDGRKTTIITGSRNVIDGATTFTSATVAAVGERFLARDITFQNTAGPSKHQAVALRVGSDLSAFYRCDILAYQDTLYVHSNRQYFVQCLITGTVDFIFGNAAVVFQDCDIQARRPNSGQSNMVTAHGRTDANQNTGIVIQKCRIGATSDLQSVLGSFNTYLGRPWKEHSRTVIMQSSITNVIHSSGWHEWDGNFALNTLYYGEYQNTGAGASTSGRVKWRGYRVIGSATEAQSYTAGRFIAGGSWLSSTGFPVTLGL